MSGSIQTCWGYMYNRVNFRRLQDINTRHFGQLTTHQQQISSTYFTFSNGWTAFRRVFTSYLVFPGRLWNYARPRFPPKQWFEFILNYFPTKVWQHGTDQWLHLFMYRWWPGILNVHVTFHRFEFWINTFFLFTEKFCNSWRDLVDT